MSKGVAQSQDCIFFLMLILLQLLDVGLSYFCYAWLKERITLLEFAVYPLYVHLTSMYITTCDEFF